MSLASIPTASSGRDFVKNDEVTILDDDYHADIEVEESLSIGEKEKELIQKALERHRGRRKDAAKELGISERTLYRKIKEYDLK